MNLRDKKGSISIFVLVALLFMAGFLIISFASNVNKSKVVKEQFNIISGIYAYGGGDEGAYNKAYTDLREKNRQTLTTYSEGSALLEVTKTFDDKVSNYRIYGNSIQDTTNGDPSPTNPVEIQSVGNVVNLLNIDNFEFVRNTTIELEEPIPAGTYTFSVLIESSDVDSDKSLIRMLDSDNNIIKSFYFTRDVRNSEIIETTVPIKKIVFFASMYNNTSAGDTAKVLDMQLEKGTIATEYTPYGKYRIPVKITGKNLINKNEFKDYGSIRKYCDLYLEPGTYYYSSNMHSTSGQTFLTAIVNNDTYEYADVIKMISVFAGTDDKAKFTITEAKTYRFLIYCANATIISNLNNAWDSVWIQIEKSDTATEYEPYKEQTLNIYLDEPLRKVGADADYIDFKNQEVIRNINRKQILSSYTWDTNWYPMIITYLSKEEYIKNGSAATVLNPYSSSAQFKGSNEGGSGIGFKSSDTYWGFADVEEMKTWLDDHPDMYAYYPLATPKEEPINLPELKTFEDYTTIQVLTDIAPSKIELEYQGYTLD